MEDITFDRMPHAIAQILKKLEVVENLLSGNSQIHNDEDIFLNVDQAAEFLNMSVSTVYSKVCRREIPAIKRGKRLYFEKNSLVGWLKKGVRKTSEELIEEANRVWKSRSAPKAFN